MGRSCRHRDRARRIRCGRHPELIATNIRGAAATAGIGVMPGAAAIPARVVRIRCRSRAVEADGDATAGATGIDVQGLARGHRDGARHLTAKATGITIGARRSTLCAVEIDAQPGGAGRNRVRLRRTCVVETGRRGKTHECGELIGGLADASAATCLREVRIDGGHLVVIGLAKSE